MNVELFYKDGTVKCRASIINGTINGPLVSYDHDGRISAVEGYDNGIKSGLLEYVARGVYTPERFYPYDDIEVDHTFRIF